MTSGKLAQYIHLVASLVGTLGIPVFATNWLHTHLTVYMWIVAASLLLHAVCPSIFGGPSQDDLDKSGLDKLGVWIVMGVLLLSLAAVPARAQTAPSLPQDVFGAGAAGSPSASPSVEGIGLYAHQISGGTYSATIFQVVPNNNPKFTVNTNIGTGVGQRLFAVAKHDVYGIVEGGISWQSANVGFQWSSLATVPFRIKQTNWYAMPFGGFTKSAVSNGTGYQVTFGALVSWGQ